MKYFKFLTFGFFAAILIVPYASGQFNGISIDSVPVLKPKRTSNVYQFRDSGIWEIDYIMHSPKEARYFDSGHILGDIGNSFLTALTNVNHSSSRDVNWEISGDIKGNNALPGWKISLFCEGHLEQDRERVKNDDGSHSVETENTISLYWDKNATGIIKERNDTIGRFLIITNPWSNPSLSPWAAEIKSEPEYVIKTTSKNKYYIRILSYNEPNYGIIGILRLKKFAIIANGNSRNIWFFTEDNPVCLFRPDIDLTGIVNKDRIQPDFFINKDIPHKERPDYYRMAIMSQFLSRNLKLR
jgi:hypothetical protein